MLRADMPRHPPSYPRRRARFSPRPRQRRQPRAPAMPGSFQVARRARVALPRSRPRAARPARRRTLGGRDPVAHRLAVARGRGVEKRLRCGRRFEHSLHLGLELRVVILVRIRSGSLCASSLERSEAGGCHPPLGHESFDVPHIDLRPGAACLAGRPALATPVIVDGLRHRIDPSEAQSLGNGIRPRQTPIGDVRLAHLHPQLRFGGVMPFEPGAELRRVTEVHRRLLRRTAGLPRLIVHGNRMPRASDTCSAVPPDAAVEPDRTCHSSSNQRLSGRHARDDADLLGCGGQPLVVSP